MSRDGRDGGEAENQLASLIFNLELLSLDVEPVPPTIELLHLNVELA